MSISNAAHAHDDGHAPSDPHGHAVGHDDPHAVGHDGHAVAHDENAAPHIGVIVVKRPNSTQQQLYLPAIITGLGVTMRHFFQNLFSKNKSIVTVQYPEEKVAYPARYRGLHRLMKREDGSVRCVACMCCPTVCPAHCITIVAEETGNGAEKRPKIFEIDELRCIVCGLCVEACPCDAIRMDTGIHMPPSEHRFDAILGKSDLLSRGSLSEAVQGGVGADWKRS